MTLTAQEKPTDVAGQPHVTVLTDRCAGCQECVVRCPAAALTMDAARWVAVADDALCVGCRQCERTCPFSAVTVEGPVLVAERAVSVAVHPGLLTGDADEVRRGFASAEEALAEANRCLDCPDPTCVRGCPAHNDIPSFVAAIRDGDLARAHDVLRLTSVLPDVCSRVCDQAAQCEGACTWSLAGGTPVAIGRLERYVADRVPVPPPVRPAGEGATLSVAVVGSGPAGIGAAWRLAEAGAAVTVYERDQQPGGLLDWGIPDFTLPEDVSARPWAHLIAAGVDLHCGTEVGPADIGRLLDEHDAVVLAHGAAVGLRLPVPGADLGGVVDATSFLKAGKAALRNGDTAGFRQAFGLPLLRWKGERPVLVLVLGAGNTAMDVARTARRIGLHAVCVDWMDERFALARPDELDEGRDEGVEVRFLRTVTRLDGKDGRVCRATLAKTRQDRPDRRPKVLAADTEHVYADLVVMAMGYRGDPAYAAMLPGTPVARTAAGLPDRQWLASGILANPAPEFARHKSVGMLALGREAGLAAAAWPVQERVWLAGDALVGPSTVVEAMAQGRRAATSILATRPSRGPRREPQRVLVAYESRGGRTARAAHLVADKLRVAGAVVRAVPLGQVRAAELAETDLLVIGTWVEGFVVSGVGPPQATRSWLAGLPRLAGLRTAAFCTFGVSPRGTLKGLSQELESRGAAVLAEAAFGPGDHGMADGTARFAERLIAAAWPSRTSQPA